MTSCDSVILLAADGIHTWMGTGEEKHQNQHFHAQQMKEQHHSLGCMHLC